MAISDIKEIRILPPLALGRFGESAEPMHNYDIPVDDVSGFRRLEPADTLVVNPSTGEILQSFRPPSVRFKDGSGLVKPVCPFLELWGRYDDRDDLLPLTLQEFVDLGLSVQTLAWHVHFANLKMLRRTGDPGDRIAVEIREISDHVQRRLDARAANFKSDRTIALGSVQFLQPTPAFPQMRFRFTPPPGRVYGAAPDGVISAATAVYDATRGTWDTHTDSAPPTNPVDPRARFTTIPQGIYAQNRLTQQNLGYFDDSSDGVVSATLTLPDGRELTTYARVSSGPPDYAPDSLPVRSMADELEQLALGHNVSTVEADEIIDIVRRARETLQLMDTFGLNRTYAEGVFSDTEAQHSTVTAIHGGFVLVLQGLKQPPESSERQNAHALLVRMDQMLRDFTEVTDRSQSGRRRMPALMRGADGLDLALTRRQRNKIRAAIEVFAPSVSTERPETAALKRMIATLQFAAGLHAAFSEGGKSLADRFAMPDEVIEYLRQSTAKGTVATAAGLAGLPLVVPGDPTNSAFLQLISRTEHPMNGPLNNYRDSVTGKSGHETVRDWIGSITPGA